MFMRPSMAGSKPDMETTRTYIEGLEMRSYEYACTVYEQRQAMFILSRETVFVKILMEHRKVSLQKKLRVRYDK